MSTRCDECSIERVFPCLYHCQKLLCLQHLGEHEDKLRFQENLKTLWNFYENRFNENQIEKQIEFYRNKLKDFRRMKSEIENLIVENRFASIDEFQRGIETVRNAASELDDNDDDDDDRSSSP